MSASARLNPGQRPNRDSIQRKQVWYIPYVVLEFDKNEVLVDAIGGDLNNPVWFYTATFDVSRLSEIAVTAYLRTSPPGGAETKDGAMGNADLCLGTIRYQPDLENGGASPACPGGVLPD